MPGVTPEPEPTDTEQTPRYFWNEAYGVSHDVYFLGRARSSLFKVEGNIPPTNVRSNEVVAEFFDGNSVSSEILTDFYGCPSSNGTLLQGTLANTTYKYCLSEIDTSFPFVESKESDPVNRTRYAMTSYHNVSSDTPAFIGFKRVINLASGDAYVAITGLYDSERNLITAGDDYEIKCYDYANATDYSRNEGGLEHALSFNEYFQTKTYLGSYQNVFLITAKRKGEGINPTSAVAVRVMSSGNPTSTFRIAGANPLFMAKIGITPIGNTAPFNTPFKDVSIRFDVGSGSSTTNTVYIPMCFVRPQ